MLVFAYGWTGLHPLTRRGEWPFPLQRTLVTDQLRALSVAMRGGSLRYQAQSLRRLRVPRFTV